jgi:hypothetical protein
MTAPRDISKIVMAGLVPAIYVLGIHVLMTWMPGPSPRMTAGTEPPSQASTRMKVAKIRYLGGHHLRATFSDGMAGEYDFSAVVGESRPMIEPLHNPGFFRAYAK